MQSWGALLTGSGTPWRIGARRVRTVPVCARIVVKRKVYQRGGEEQKQLPKLCAVHTTGKSDNQSRRLDRARDPGRMPSTMTLLMRQ